MEILRAFFFVVVALGLVGSMLHHLNKGQWSKASLYGALIVIIGSLPPMATN